MPDESRLIQSLRGAVEAAPEDVPLRLHLGQLLLDAGRASEAVVEAAAALQRDPDNEEARALMTRAVAPPSPGPGPAPAQPPAPGPGSSPAAPAAGFDWHQAEDEVADIVEPRFVTGTPEEPGDSGEPGAPHEPGMPDESGTPEAPLTADGNDDPGETSLWDVESAGGLRLADVGGMREVKERLEAAFLAPLRNPELRKLYGKSLRGGLLLYGPPGCGKTFLARAVAGELGASFLNVALSDVLDMWVGASERNLSSIFKTARRNAPCVVFLDELDALGGKRSRIQHGGMRNTVNQLLTELDGVGSENDGVFVLAATNHPWDVDSALRRPGRLDRTLLVLPPDEEARQAVLHYHLRERPVAGVDLGKLARRTDGFSGADLAHVCETASEYALMDSVRSGEPRMIDMADLTKAAKELRPSTEAWFGTARNVAMYANNDGTYDDLLAYLKKRKLL
ncbi:MULTISPECIES: ATP-binding protein [unclassified Streptomyces]|uniref:ATP-binding protein n=1 Tax=unclassified Streptomyces TaxID=2593676 RepID=UPI002DDA54E9|nr:MULTISPECIES: ATP-binding protein [unclassified Streptomyces]WSA93079.1 ATP-binding protein [Streptomyces sp. NBC_01795]WSB77448.1 ATP-binding protein [Streptomyces sp. NBC_01775]WSS14286.1 ATP-binding protein [Streptomyces sp. NBC_01186]WSS43104.1 ATP-binding protein [Streptomyces sp. NBC_01187]